MPIVRRTPPRAASAQQEQVQIERPTTPSVMSHRKLRTTSSNTAAHRFQAAVTARKQIDAHLKSIAQAETAIDEATTRIDAAHREIEQLMYAAAIQQHSNGVHVAEIVEEFTRQQRTIHPKTFRAKVSNDVFWDSISINIGKAKEHLSEREINEISDVVPAKSLGMKLKIRPKKG